MATNRTDSLIKVSGTAGSDCDYTSVSTWVAAIGGAGIDGYTNADLTAAGDDIIHYGWLFAEEIDVAGIVIAGQTTDADCYIQLAADSAGGTVAASQHSYTSVDAALMDDSSRALAYNTSYASILCNNTYDFGLTLTAPFTRISRLQFGDPATGAHNTLKVDGADATVDRCFFQIGYQYASAITANFRIEADTDFNSCLFSIKGAVLVSAFNNSGTTLTNCTVTRSTGAALSATAKQFAVDYGRPPMTNCAFFGGGYGSEYTGTNGGNAWGTLDYNATDFSDLSSRSGEGANNSYSNGTTTFLQTNQFTAVDGTDWRVKAGHELGVGTDKTATVPYDIWGVAFETGTSICGCEQYVAAGGGTTGILRQHTSNIEKGYSGVVAAQLGGVLVH